MSTKIPPTLFPESSPSRPQVSLSLLGTRRRGPWERGWDSPNLLCLKMAKFDFNYSNITNQTLSKFQVESKSDAAGLQFS